MEEDIHRGCWITDVLISRGGGFDSVASYVNKPTDLLHHLCLNMGVQNRPGSLQETMTNKGLLLHLELDQQNQDHQLVLVLMV